MKPFEPTQIMESAFHYAHKLNPAGGTCLEFGVGFGGTYSWMVSKILKQYPGSSLIGFEGWKGLPKETTSVFCPPTWKEGAYETNKDDILDVIKAVGGDITPYGQFQIVDGWFENTLTPELREWILRPQDPSNVIFINIDVDLHSSTKTVLNWVKPFLKNNVVIYWDDWRDPAHETHQHIHWGENLAWFEFVKENPVITETIQINHINQRYMRIVEL